MSLPPNVKPMQLTANLIGPDNEEYRLLFVRAPVTFLGLLMWPGTQAAVISIALIAVAATSLLLARYLSSPIVRLQKASRSLAAGALDTRVGQPFTRRKDEVGTLARDFDAMAERIQALVTDKETLLRDVSHELRSPLARIRMALALAQRRADQAAQPDLARIEREAEKLDELVGHVMTLSRLRTATAPRRDVVRLDSLVAEVVEDARFERPEAKLEYSASGEVLLRGDPDGLKSAVENVVRNALVYGDPAQPIEVRLEAGADEAAVRVLDRGPGVPPEDLAKIFEPFFRTDKSRDHAARRPRDRPRDHGARDGAARRQRRGAQPRRRRARGDPHAADPGRARARSEAVAALLVQYEIESLVLLLTRYAQRHDSIHDLQKHERRDPAPNGGRGRPEQLHA